MWVQPPPPVQYRGVEKMVSRQAHNLKNGGSSPPSATNLIKPNKKQKMENNIKTGTWFNTKVEYVNIIDGKDKKFKENYVVEAFSCGEAENIAMDKLSCYTAGVDILSVTKCAFSEIIFMEDQNIDGEWYEAVVELISFDEKTNKEKKTKYKYLVEALNINAAVTAIDKYFKNSMVDYANVQVKKTNIVEVYTKEVE